LRAVLHEARHLTSSHVLTLFGSAGERDLEKRAIQGAVAQELADFAIFTSEDPRFEDADAIIAEIAAGAEQAGGRRGVDFECIEDRRDAIFELISRARPGDVVILTGKGHERSLIYGNRQRAWDEPEVAREALEASRRGAGL
jgi:UDP-N-acetylmuramoyl-L-alanyl-D-glutamate--2,6-diaminopimelate ligase